MISKIQRLLFIGILCFFMFGLTGCKKGDSMKEDYPGLEDKIYVKNISAEELVNKVSNKDTFVIFMGFPACPWCQAGLPVYNECLKDLNYKDGYYIDIKDMRDNEESKDHIYYLALKNYFNEVIDEKNDRINAPTVIAVKDGVLKGYHLDTVESHVKDETGTLPTLSNEQVSELKDIYTNLIKLTY